MKELFNFQLLLFILQSRASLVPTIFQIGIQHCSSTHKKVIIFLLYQKRKSKGFRYEHQKNRNFCVCNWLLLFQLRVSSAVNGFNKLFSQLFPQMEGISGEILVGAVYPITGHSSLAGASVEYGIELAVAEINNAQHSDVKIKLIMEDGRSTVEGAVEAFNKLIHEDKVSVILGPGSSSQAQEAFPIVHQNQVVAISPTSAASGLSAVSDFVFRTNLTTDVLIPNGVKGDTGETRIPKGGNTL